MSKYIILLNAYSYKDSNWKAYPACFLSKYLKLDDM